MEPEDVTKREVTVLGKRRGSEGQVRMVEGGRSYRVWILAGLAIVAFLAIFGVIVWYDMAQRGGGVGNAPEGVEKFDIAKGAGKHVQETVDYEQDPPAGGEHNPIWQNSGFYEEPVRNETAVHTQEHGAVWITYDPELSEDDKATLRDVVEAQDCVVASPYPGLPEGVPLVASAWGAQLQLSGVDDPNLQGFIRSYRKGPQTPEPGAACTGGTGEPA